MVIRRHLTPTMVNELRAPTKGESWVADTAVRGFGVRLWNTQGGGQKAYAVRVSDNSGTSIRKTFINNPWDDFFDDGDKSLGAKLEDARHWARAEIRQLKFAGDTEHIWAVAGQKAQSFIKRQSLARAAQELILRMRLRGLSQRYVDRLDKLFSTHIPYRLRTSELQNVNPSAVANALISEQVSGANARTLRSFLSQIYLEASASNHGFSKFPEQLSKNYWKLWEKHRDVRYPELRKLKKKDYRRLFRILERTSSWQHGYAIRLYFKFGVPMQRLLAARWAQIVGDTWYPYAPDERLFWYAYGERLDEEALELIKKVHALASKNFEPSAFLFPSPTKVGESIRTVQSFWRGALETAQIKYYPLKEFSRSYRNFNNPSYHRWLCEYLGEAFARGANVAELSKILSRRENTTYNSMDCAEIIGLHKT
jgi:hypothetical protein